MKFDYIIKKQILVSTLEDLVSSVKPLGIHHGEELNVNIHSILSLPASVVLGYINQLHPLVMQNELLEK